MRGQKNIGQQCCAICGFDKILEQHHIIKRKDYGSNSLAHNLVMLCPNHHKMADSIEYGDLMKDLIFKKTGKKGKTLSTTQINKIKRYVYKKTKKKEEDWYFQYIKNNLMLSIGFYRRLERGIIR